MRPEADPEPLQLRHQLGLGKGLGPVERHVLDEVRQPALVVVLLEAAGVDHKPELAASGRLLVLPDEVGQAVRQHPLLHLRVERQHCRRVRRQRRLRDRRLLLLLRLSLRRLLPALSPTPGQGHPGEQHHGQLRAHRRSLARNAARDTRPRLLHPPPAAVGRAPRTRPGSPRKRRPIAQPRLTPGARSVRWAGQARRRMCCCDL